MTYEYIDAERINGLARDLVGDMPSCVRFIDDFVGSSVERIARIRRAVDQAALDDALASLLSLATSSSMIGAETLANAARDLHAEAMRSGSIPGPAAQRLEVINSASCAELVRLTAPWRVAA
jgi:hypothetical protein